MTQQVAEAVNRSHPATANTNRLLKLPRTVQDLVEAGKLTPSLSVALLRYESMHARRSSRSTSPISSFPAPG
jgi:hypothetical protein